MRSPISLITVAYSAVALASYLAVRSFAAALEEMRASGGGIAAIALGAGEAARFPLVAAWIAAVAIAIAIILVLPPLRRSAAGEETDAGGGLEAAVAGRSVRHRRARVGAAVPLRRRVRIGSRNPRRAATRRTSRFWA
jgi:hypothetical protein